jgi:FkbM family methyltransferase
MRILRNAIREVLHARGIALVQTGKRRRGHSPGAIVEFAEQGVPIRFFVENTFDVIQGWHSTCNFYERDELDLLSRHISVGASYVDIGANVGNHAIFAGKLCNVGRIIAFEPSPDSLRVLRFNIDLNQLSGIATIHPVAASDCEGDLLMQAPPSNNLGSARVMQGSGEGAVAARLVDDLLTGEAVDFVKIDVEGHELHALRGLQRTINTKRPKMYVEVDNENIVGFRALMNTLDYVVVESRRSYAENENFLVAPR